MPSHINPITRLEKLEALAAKLEREQKEAEAKMQEGSRHLLKLKSTGDCPRTNNGAHLIEMPDDDAISRGRLPWCVQCGLEFSKTEAELMRTLLDCKESLTKIKEWAKPEIQEPDQSTWAEGYDAARRWVRDVLIR
jgi:hypothetical protein